jgi:mono/diheme cytochrome c family protein
MHLFNGTILASRCTTARAKELTKTDMRIKKFTCFVAAAVAAATAFGAATSIAPADDTKSAVPEAARKEAQEIFSTRCTVCHGTSGKGDGPGSAALNPKPRNFTDPEWQKSVNDEYIEKIIQYGGIAVGKSPMMPGNPDLTAKPDVVKGIRETVRQLAEKH